MKSGEESLKQTFRLVTYNIQITNHPHDIVANIVSMSQEGVQIFCLQEIREIAGQLFVGDLLQTELGPHWKIEYFLDNYALNTSHGLAILWNSQKMELKTVKKIFLPQVEKTSFIERAVEKMIGFTGKPSPRKAMICTFSLAGTPVRITNLHLDWQRGRKQRLIQLQYLMNQLPTKPQIVAECICGDFNTGHVLRKNKEQFNLADFFGEQYADVTRNIPWTIDWYNADFTPRFQFVGSLMKSFGMHIYQKLDYIWVKNLEAKDVHTLTLSGSDHLPILAELKIKNKQ